MKFYGQAKFMGSDNGITKNEGKKYFKVGFMQGLESQIVYVDEDTYGKYQNIPAGADIDIIVNVQCRGDKTYFSIIDLQVVTSGKAKVS